MNDPEGTGNNPRRNAYEKSPDVDWGPFDNDHWRCSCNECKYLLKLRQAPYKLSDYERGRADGISYAAGVLKLAHPFRRKRTVALELDDAAYEIKFPPQDRQL